jgi:alpha-methylacyl-CoA racemase
VGDYAGGSLFLVVGILSALFEAQKSGKGQVVDAAITDGSAHLMSMFYTMRKMGAWNTARGVNMLDGGVPYYGAYETADGKHVSVGPIEPQFFAEMVQTTGMPESFIQDQNNQDKWPEIRATMESTFKSKSRDEWVEIFEGTDACVAGILNFEEAVQHPHNQSRQTYIEVAGDMQPAPAPRFSRSQCDVPAAPSAEGADTKSVLADFGFDADAIAALDSAGILT